MSSPRNASLAGVLLLVSGMAPLLADGDVCTWSSYVAHPDVVTCRCLEARLRLSKQERPSPAETTKLVTLVDSGDACAADLAFSTVRLLDGGDLENVDRALSGLAGQHPALLLRMLARHRYSKSVTDRLLRMLPLTTVDDWPAKRRVVTDRIAAVSEVRDPKLRHIRTIALDSLRRYLKELNAHGDASLNPLRGHLLRGAAVRG